MSGYIARLDALRAAVETGRFKALGMPKRYLPADDALLRRAAERLSDDQIDDVVALIKLARESP